LFLQFVETPEFNPEALQLQTVPLEFKSRLLVQLVVILLKGDCLITTCVYL